MRKPCLLKAGSYWSAPRTCSSAQRGEQAAPASGAAKNVQLHRLAARAVRVQAKGEKRDAQGMQLAAGKAAEEARIGEHPRGKRCAHYNRDERQVRGQRLTLPQDEQRQQCCE